MSVEDIAKLMPILALIGFTLWVTDGLDHIQARTFLRLVGEFWKWSSLNAMLSNSTARVLYALPIVGYVILYSDYFQSRFKFTALSSRGFLPFTTRINMIYYGSIVLGIAFILFMCFCPPLLRNKRDFQHFASDMMASRDLSTVYRIVPSTIKYLDRLLPNEKDETKRLKLEKVLDFMKRRGTVVGENAGEFEINTPDILRVYYDWQSYRMSYLRLFIFCLTIFAYGFLALPSFDLFLQVLRTSLKEYNTLLCSGYVKAFQMLHISAEYAPCIEWLQP